MRDDAITPAEREYTDAVPAKEEPSLSVAPAPRVVRTLWPDLVWLLGVLFAPILIVLGCLGLGWSLFGWSPASGMGILAGIWGLSVGACCMWPLSRAPRGTRVALLCAYLVLVSVFFSLIYFLFVVFPKILAGFGGG
jgi:hypothetical protein